MFVRFGLDFDGMLPFLPESRIGYVTAGPQQLLSILETQLGLLPVAFSGGARIVQYWACLKEANNPGRFYHRSFEADELGVARTLLDWRDRWHEAGWEGKFDRSAGKRLDDLAEVESIARGRVAPSAGERLSSAPSPLDPAWTPYCAINSCIALTQPASCSSSGKNCPDSSAGRPFSRFAGTTDICSRFTVPAISS